MARALKVQAPTIDASVQSGAARRLIDQANSEIRASYLNIIEDPDLDDNAAVLALTELELYSARVVAEALRLELEHVQRQLQEVYQARGARVVHVRRDSTGNIIQLVGIDGTAA
jgi:hypothetical protein